MFLINSAGGNILKPWPVVGAAEFWETPKHIMESYRVLQYLVGGLEHFLFFHLLGNNHPNWLSYASEGFVYHQPDRVSQYGFTTYRRYGFHQVGFWSAEQKLQMTCCDHPRNPRRKVWPEFSGCPSATWTASPLRRLAAETDEVDAPPIGPGWRWHSWSGVIYIYIEPTS